MSDKFQDIYRIPSARAVWWDYRNDAAYFVTICTAGREHYFGEINDEIISLSEMGKIANQNWMRISEHFPFIKLDAFVVMPNHIHGILVIDHSVDIENHDTVETLHATSLQSKSGSIKNEEMAAISPKRGSLSSVIRSYKSSVTKQARQIHADFAWQTRFHDHIIRDLDEYWKIRNYILNNPANWGKDKYNQPETP
jgi:putative transposase